MIETDLADIYRNYIACLNWQDWPRLGQFVDADVRHNGRPLGLSGYRAMLEQDFRDIPDLHFNIDLLVCNTAHVASRLAFDCSPKGQFLGLDVDGRRVSFAENVFYECWRKDRAGMVGDRQDGDRGLALEHDPEKCVAVFRKIMLKQKEGVG